MGSRLPFFALAVTGLLSGLWAGWVRLGYDLPGLDLATLHGPLMVGGFVGTLIGIERSFLSGNGKWWIIPMLSGAAVAAWLLGFTREAPLMLMAASAFLVILQVIHLWRSREWLSGIVQLLGALCFLAGNFRLLVDPFMPAIVPFWMGFVLCFILATRLSVVTLKNMLTRLAVRGGLLLYLASLAVPFHFQGNLFGGAGLMLIAFGMMITEFEQGSALPSIFETYCLSGILTAWLWLLFAGIGLIFWQEHLYGYDATVHAFFVGFLFSMVFVHALGKAAVLAGLAQPPFHPLLFTWMLLLSLSLLLRIFCGDMLTMDLIRKWSGLLNGLAILGFLISLISLTVIRRYKNKYVPV